MMSKEGLRRLLSMQLAAWSLGCTEAPQASSALASETSLEGLVFGVGPKAGVPVRVRNASGLVGETTTDLEGRWRLALGPLAGEVEVTSGVYRRTLSVEVGASRPVVLGAVGMLGDAYEAWGGPAVEVETVLGGTPSDQVELSDLRASAEFGPTTVAGLFQSAIPRLGQDLQALQGGAGASEDLVLALVEDLKADGLFDGRGRDGGTLFFAGRALDPYLLRRDLVRSIRSFLGSSEHQSGLNARVFESYLTDLLYSKSKLFPPATWLSPDATVPVVADLVLQQESLQRPEGTGLRGAVMLRAGVSDDDLVTRTRVELLRPSAPTRVLSDVRDEEGLSDLRADLDTRDYGDGPVTFRVSAFDRGGHEGSVQVGFVFDNTPPVLTATVPASVIRPDLLVMARVVDAESGAASVRLEVDGVEVLEVPARDGEHLQIPLTVPCRRAGVDVGVWAEDAAGNATRTVSRVVCDEAGPPMTIMRKTWLQEDNGTFEVTFDRRFGPQDPAYYVYSARREEYGTFETGQVTSIRKFWHRLFGSYPNPVQVELQTPATRVEYAWRMGQEPLTSFRPLAMRPGGGYRVGINYTEVPELARFSGQESALVLRGYDARGALTEVELRFVVEVKYPTVIVDGCTAQRVGYADLPNHLGSGPAQVLGRASIHYPVAAVSAPPPGIEPVLLGVSSSASDVVTRSMVEGDALYAFLGKRLMGGGRDEPPTFVDMPYPECPAVNVQTFRQRCQTAGNPVASRSHPNVLEGFVLNAGTCFMFACSPARQGWVRTLPWVGTAQLSSPRVHATLEGLAPGGVLAGGRVTLLLGGAASQLSVGGGLSRMPTSKPEAGGTYVRLVPGTSPDLFGPPWAFAGVPPLSPPTTSRTFVAAMSSISGIVQDAPTVHRWVPTVLGWDTRLPVPTVTASTFSGRPLQVERRCQEIRSSTRWAP